MPTDSRSALRRYPKPSIDNTVAEDFARTIDTIDMIDTDVASLMSSVAQRALLMHTHSIGEVFALQDALDAKAAADHVHALSGMTDVDVGSVTNGQWLRRVAGKWQPAAISAGDVSGLGSMATESTSNYIRRANGAAVVPGWANDAGRPASPANGWIGYNAARARFEGYQGGAWLPIGSAVARVEMVYSAATGNLAAGQTVFTVSGGYTVGNLDIIRNGVDLVVGTDVTASNGATFTLTTAALAGDVIKTRTYVSVQVLNDAAARGATSYPTMVDASEASILAATKAVVLHGRSTPGDSGVSAVFRRVDAEPAHAAKFRSADRYLSTGATSSANGGWWERVLDEWGVAVPWYGQCDGAVSVGDADRRAALTSAYTHWASLCTGTYGHYQPTSTAVPLTFPAIQKSGMASFDVGSPVFEIRTVGTGSTVRGAGEDMRLRHISIIIEDVRCKVENIHIDGASRTCDAFVLGGPNGRADEFSVTDCFTYQANRPLVVQDVAVGRVSRCTFRNSAAGILVQSYNTTANPDASGNILLEDLNIWGSLGHLLELRSYGEVKCSNVTGYDSELPSVIISGKNGERSIQQYFSNCTFTNSNNDLASRQHAVITSVTNNGAGKVRVNFAAGSMSYLYEGSRWTRFDFAGVYADGVYTITNVMPSSVDLEDLDYVSSTTGVIYHQGWDVVIDNDGAPVQEIGETYDIYFVGGNINNVYVGRSANVAISGTSIPQQLYAADGCLSLSRIGTSIGRYGRGDVGSMAYDASVPISGPGRWMEITNHHSIDGATYGAVMRSPADGTAYAGNLPRTVNEVLVANDGVTLSGGSLAVRSAETDVVRKVLDLAALVAIPDARLSAGEEIRVVRHSTAGGAGTGGMFSVVSAADNPYPIDGNGLVLASAGGGFVFIRSEFLETGRLSPKWFGANGKSSTDQTTALDNWLACYDSLNATVMSGDLVADVSPWLHVPQGNFVWATGRVWNPQCGFPTMRGDGANSVLHGLTIALYNDNSDEAGAQQFAEMANFKLYGRNTQDYGIVLGHPTDLGGSLEGRWGGVREGRLRNLIVTNYAKHGLFVVRDNHTRIESCVFNRNGLDGVLYIMGIDTEFSGVHAQLNSRHGIHIQPWAGDGTVGPYSGVGPGGLSWTDCNARYNGKGNFFATGGDPAVVISSTDTEDGVADLDFLGGTTLRVGNWWESYFVNCSWANITTGSPASQWLSSTVTSIVADTTNPLEIKVTLATPHNFHRGIEFDNSQLRFTGTGMSYDSMAPRSGTTYVVKEVYSATEFALNVAHTTDFSGAATFNRPRYDFVIKGQEKGYTSRNIRDLWFTGKNHNYTFLERCSYVRVNDTRLKLQIVLGADVVGFERNHTIGIRPDPVDSDNHVPVLGAGADTGHFAQGLRQFDVPWPGWTTGTPTGPAQIGYSMERPVTGGGARTDHAAGAARYFHAVHWRPSSITFGRYDAQGNTYRGLNSKADGDIEFVNEAGVKGTWDASTGQMTWDARVFLKDSYVTTTTTTLPNAVVATSGNIMRYVGDPIVEEGSNANGSWIKFASGTMICRSPEKTLDVTTAVGSIYKSATTEWEYPVAFASSDVNVTVSNTGNSSTHWGAARTGSSGGSVTTLTGATISLFAPTSTTGQTFKAVAIGKWK